MASTTNATLTKLLDEVQALRREVAALKTTKTPSGSGRKPSKPRDPDAPPKAPNAWIVFTGVVREALKAAGKPAGKEAQQFASHLKTSFPEAYEMDAEAIMAEHASWVPPPPKPKAEPEAVADGEAKPKPKRTLTEAQKAAMAEGRRKAAAKRKAEAEAAKASDDAEVPEPSPKAPPKPPVASEGSLTPFPFKGKRCLLDPATKGVWLREADGSQGIWLGVLSDDRKSIDDSVPDPEAE